MDANAWIAIGASGFSFISAIVAVFVPSKLSYHFSYSQKIYEKRLEFYDELEDVLHDFLIVGRASDDDKEIPYIFSEPAKFDECYWKLQKLYHKQFLLKIETREHFTVFFKFAKQAKSFLEQEDTPARFAMGKEWFYDWMYRGGNVLIHMSVDYPSLHKIEKLKGKERKKYLEAMIVKQKQTAHTNQPPSFFASLLFRLQKKKLPQADEQTGDYHI